MTPDRLEDDAATRPVAEIAGYLQEQVGQRVAAAVAGLVNAEQISRYACGVASPGTMIERRLREGFKAVRLLVDAYDGQTACAWLFGTNIRLDDRAPIDVLAAACETSEFEAVAEAARAVAGRDWSFQFVRRK